MRRSLVALALLAASCTPEVCARTSDCATGLVCTAAGLCRIPDEAGTDAAVGSTVASDAPLFSDAARDGTPDAQLRRQRSCVLAPAVVAWLVQLNPCAPPLV